MCAPEFCKRNSPVENNTKEMLHIFIITSSKLHFLVFYSNFLNELSCPFYLNVKVRYSVFGRRTKRKTFFWSEEEGGENRIPYTRVHMVDRFLFYRINDKLQPLGGEKRTKCIHRVCEESQKHIYIFIQKGLIYPLGSCQNGNCWYLLKWAEISG